MGRPSLLASYDLDLDVAVAEVRKRGARLVGLQFPDGLRDFSVDVAEWLEEETGVPMLVSADPCFGACDLALNLTFLGCDLLLNFGHTEMPSNPATPMPVVFLPARSKAPVAEVALRAAEALGVRRVGLVSMAQHMHKLPEARAALEEAGFQVLVGDGDNRVAGAGQVLGCNYTTATRLRDAEGFVYVGTGDFHPLGLALAVDKPLAIADPQSGEVRTVTDLRDKVLRKRFAQIAAARDARRFAVLVCPKVGQMRLKMAMSLVEQIRAKGRSAVLVALDYVTPDALQYFRHLDCWVSTACPRIAIDDAWRYPVPMLTPPELAIVLGDRTWDDYVLDEFYGTGPRKPAGLPTV